MLEDDNTASETYELYGPTNYSMAEIAELVDKEIYKKRRHINVPKVIAEPFAKLLNQAIWWHTTSKSEVEREFIDQEIDPNAKTFKDLGIEPAELRNYTFHYLVCTFVFGLAPRILIGPTFDSKGTGAPHFMIYHQPQRGKSERKKSIFTFSTISK